MGTYTSGGARTEEYLEKLFTLGPVNVPTLIFNATVGNIAASATALELKLRGPNVTVSQKEASACSRSATLSICCRPGQARALVAGGVDALFPLFYRVHDSFRVLSHANGAPEGSRPFDATRNGFVLGEGGFGVVLELESVARARNTPIYAEILSVERGGATTGLNQWPPSAGPLRPVDDARPCRCRRRRRASTSCMPARTRPKCWTAWRRKRSRTYSAAAGRLITSIKGAIGESSAAGAAAVVAAIACARAGSAPPIAGLRTPDSACAGLRLAMKAEGAGPLALVNSVASRRGDRVHRAARGGLTCFLNST